MQTSLLDLKEHASSLASSGLKKDSKLKSLEINLEQKKEECHKLESQFKRVRPQHLSVIIELNCNHISLLLNSIHVAESVRWAHWPYREL